MQAGGAHDICHYIFVISQVYNFSNFSRGKKTLLLEA